MQKNMEELRVEKDRQQNSKCGRYVALYNKILIKKQEVEDLTQDRIQKMMKQ